MAQTADPSPGVAQHKPFPDHLGREDHLLDVETNVCACCGGALHTIGESVRLKNEEILAGDFNLTMPRQCRNIPPIRSRTPPRERLGVGAVADID